MSTRARVTEVLAVQWLAAGAVHTGDDRRTVEQNRPQSTAARPGNFPELRCAGVHHLPKYKQVPVRDPMFYRPTAAAFQSFPTHGARRGCAGGRRCSFDDATRVQIEGDSPNEGRLLGQKQRLWKLVWPHYPLQAAAVKIAHDREGCLRQRPRQGTAVRRPPSLSEREGWKKKRCSAAEQAGKRIRTSGCAHPFLGHRGQ